jgi:hypothetical protein
MASDQSKTPSPPTFPLTEKPKFCWANEHMAPPFIQRSTWTFKHSELGEITRPYYICITCNNCKTNVCRNCGYPRGFITWDDNIGLHPDNPRCYCGLPSRQDRKSRKYPLGSVEDGFWICASGACGYYSERRGGAPYEKAKMWSDDDEFRPRLLEGIPPFR